MQRASIFVYSTRAKSISSFDLPLARRVNTRHGQIPLSEWMVSESPRAKLKLIDRSVSHVELVALNVGILVSACHINTNGADFIKAMRHIQFAKPVARRIGPVSGKRLIQSSKIISLRRQVPMILKASMAETETWVLMNSMGPMTRGA